MTPSEVERCFRENAAQAVASLAKALGEIESAEDAVQEAYVAALERWPGGGLPTRPAAWIYAVARNRALDRLRREQRSAEKLRLLAASAEVSDADPESVEETTIPDDRLAMIFACCHPSIQVDARVALTLRAVGGLSTEEIADAFLVAPQTMAKRLVRVKQKIREAAIPIAVPASERFAERLEDVCSVIYLIFNEGYLASSGDHLTRVDLCEEAIALGRMLSALIPDEPEVHGLNALMLYHHSRRLARIDESGSQLTLEEQDRSLWDRAMIAHADAHLTRASSLGREGHYQIQAAIASFHAAAATPQEVDWRSIATLYTRLAALRPSPVVELNRAIAIGFAEGPRAGLAAIDAVAGGQELDDYRWLHAARAAFLRRLGETEAARSAYDRALGLTKNLREQSFLRRQISELST